MASNEQADLIRSWSYDTEKFFIEALNWETLTNQQKEAANELDKLVCAKLRAAGEPAPWRWPKSDETEYVKKIGLSIMAGQGPGKGAFAAGNIIRFLCCFPFSKLPCTGPTGHQVRDNLWAEINKWLRKSNVKEWLTWQSEKVYFTEHEGKEWFAVARTCNMKGSAEDQADTLSGFHEDYMLAVIDEGAGVPDPVFKPFEGTLTGICNIVLLLFNPTRSKGFAIDTQTKDRDRWVCLRWNCEESEIVSREHIEGLAKKYGRESNVYRIRVLGLPPKTGDRCLVEWDWAEDAIEREIEPLDTDPEVLGIDPGAGGDPTVLYRRKGPVIYPAEITDTPESEVLTGWIMKRIAMYEPSMVFLDTNGIGWGIEGNLRDRGVKTEIIGVNVSDAASNDDRFYRLRDELCWRVRERFEQRAISIPNDPSLINEITSIKYDDERTDGTIKIESKKDLIKRSVDMGSTNRLDALALTEYYDWSLVRALQLGARRKQTQRNVSWRTI